MTTPNLHWLMAQLSSHLDSSLLRPGGWRRVRGDWSRPQVWCFWLLTFWCGLVGTQFAPRLNVLVFPLAIAAALALFVLGHILYRAAVAPLLARLGEAEPVPPPPSRGGPDVTYLTPPRPDYPPVALLRGQCGWVLLRLRIDARGRVRAFRVIEQAPRRTFEGAVADALLAARLPPGEEQEASALFVLVTPGPHAPEWAKARLPPPQS